jgi:hypothetical protein
MRDETKKPLWNLIQEMVFASFTGYRSLMMLAAILKGSEDKESAIDHYVWYLMNSSQTPKDETLTLQEIDEMVETCVHEHLKQITYAAVDSQYMLGKYGLDAFCPEESRIGYYINAMEEQHRCLDWDEKKFVFSAEQLKDGTVAEVGAAHYGFAEILYGANHGRFLSHIAIDKRPMHEKRIEQFKRIFHGNLEFMCVDVEEEFDYLVNLECPIMFTNVMHCLKKPLQLFDALLVNGKTPVILVVEHTPMSTLAYAFDFHMKAHGQWGQLWPATFDKFAQDFPQWNYQHEYPNKQYSTFRFTKK